MPMSPRLLRPVSGIHPEAMDWRTRVIANGGSVDGATMSAVSQFCRRIDGSGLRGRFYRLNLFCGNSIEAALVPLYQAESRTASARGNTTDTNTGAGPFVSGDYNNTGASSGLKANGTSKFLNTGLAANSVTASNAHLAIGLRQSESRSPAARTAIGSFNGSANSLEIGAHASSNPSRAGSAFFTRFGTSTDCCGDDIGVTPGALAVGDIIAAYPSMYRNGSVTGATATTSQNYPSAHSIYVFANNNQNSSVINYTDARINWYSIGLTMTAAQALSFYNAVAAFNTALSRT
jgi:hypothetical protein